VVVSEKQKCKFCYPWLSCEDFTAKLSISRMKRDKKIKKHKEIRPTRNKKKRNFNMTTQDRREDMSAT